MKAKKKRPARTPQRLTDALISQALNDAAQDAVEVHQRAGLPLVVWRDGKVALVPAEEIASNGKDATSGRPKSRR
jgi:hypothetical protein